MEQSSKNYALDEVKASLFQKIKISESRFKTDEVSVGKEGTCSPLAVLISETFPKLTACQPG